MAYHAGQRVEVLDNEPGLENSYHGATFLHFHEHQVVVRYETLTNNEGELLIAQLPFDNIRPYPNPIDVQLFLGETVDVWYNNGWWRGRLRSHNPNHPQQLQYRVRFENMLDGEHLRSFTREHIRIHQEFGFLNDEHLISDWSYLRITGYHPGCRIEVIGFEPGMENSYFGATFIDNIDELILIEYETLIDDHGHPLREEVAVQNIRPYPATVVAEYVIGEHVDVWFNEGWWRGRYHQYEPNHPQNLVHTVIFTYMPQDEQLASFTTDQLRLHQNFVFHDPFNFLGIWDYQLL